MKRVAAALLCIVSLVACAHRQTPTDTLTIVQQREPLSLNAALENGVSATQWGLLLFNYLVKWNDRGELVADVATEVPTLSNGGISPDGKTITYHLRSGLRFSDGTPLTARDCVYSIEAVQNPRNNVQTRYGYDRIASAQAPDATTLVLHLREPFAPLLTLVLAPQGFPILPRHVLAQYPDFNHLSFNEHPVGAGPYVVRRWTRSDRVELDANPWYFGGKPRIAHLVIRFVPDSNTAINQLHTGEAQGFFNDQNMGDLPLLASLTNVHVIRTPINAVGALIFNTQDPITQDPRVRRALTQALDIPSLVAKTYRGAVDARDAGRGLFEWAYDPRSPLVAPYDPRNAQRLLDASGWHRRPDGTREKGGRTLDILLLIQANTPGDEIIASAIQQAERQIGVTVTIKPFNVTQFAAPAESGGPVYGGKFQMALYPFVNGDDPDVTDQFACANVPPHGYNKSRVCDRQLDELLTRGRTTYDPQQRKAIYSKIQARLSELLPIVLLYQRREIDAFDTRVHGASSSVSSVFWNIGQWALAR